MAQSASAASTSWRFSNEGPSDAAQRAAKSSSRLAISAPRRSGASRPPGDCFVDGAGSAVDHRFVGVDLRGGARQLLADEAELDDALAELLALCSVLDAELEDVLHPADGEGGQLQPADVEDVEGDLVALTDLAEHVLGR